MAVTKKAANAVTNPTQRVKRVKKDNSSEAKVERKEAKKD
jgi:hypothetical protein